MYFRKALLGAFVIGLLAACGTSAAPADPPPAADVAISSDSMSFDTTTLNVPAGRAFTLYYVNGSPMPHNVAIYRDSSASEAMFVGEVIGEESTSYEVPALPAGEYFFRCDLHPEMKGTVVAR